MRISAQGARLGPARGSAAGFKAAVLATLAVALMVSDHRQNHLAWIRAGLTAAAWPLQWLVHSPVAAGEWLGETFSSRDRILEENTRLREAQKLLELRLLRFESLEQENQRLREMTDAVPEAATRAEMAEVLRVDLDPFRQRVLVNKGARRGVFIGQAVVDAGGIVGQVRRVGPLSAEVILISDAEHAIPVQVNRNGLRTIANGSGNPDTLVLPYLPRNADIREGDLLLSSGLGGTFPAGYPVARITEVRRDPAEPLAVIRARPLAALDRDREVLLIWFPAPTLDVVETPPGAEATTPKPATAPATPPATKPAPAPAPTQAARQ